MSNLRLTRLAQGKCRLSAIPFESLEAPDSGKLGSTAESETDLRRLAVAGVWAGERRVEDPANIVFEREV